MGAIFLAAFAYFFIVFLIGFALGTLRVLVTAPILGETGATIAELPVMLVASWIICKWALSRWKIPATGSARIAVGGVAFAFLIGAEFTLGMVAFGKTWEQIIANYRQTGPLLGLLAQILFGLFPAIQVEQPRGKI